MSSTAASRYQLIGRVLPEIEYSADSFDYKAIIMIREAVTHAQSQLGGSPSEAVLTMCLFMGSVRTALSLATFLKDVLEKIVAESQPVCRDQTIGSQQYLDMNRETLANILTLTQELSERLVEPTVIHKF